MKKAYETIYMSDILNIYDAVLVKPKTVNTNTWSLNVYLDIFT